MWMMIMIGCCGLRFSSWIWRGRAWGIEFCFWEMIACFLRRLWSCRVVKGIAYFSRLITSIAYRSVEEDGGDGVFRGRDIGVCDLDDGSVKPLADYPEYSKLFWPPPDWAVSTTLGVQNQFKELQL